MEPHSLLDIIRAVTRRSLADEEKVAVAYSGGLDSSLIAKLAAESAHVVCYSCGAEGSSDFKEARGYGLADGFEVRVLRLRATELPFLVSRTSHAIASKDPLKVAYTIPTVLVLEQSEEEFVLGGNGADELFAGYAKYSKSRETTEARMKDDLKKSIDEARRLQAYARSIGKRAIFPFLSEEVVAAANATPLGLKISGDSRKTILREVGILAGLAAADRAKKAAQYSSGTLKMMRIAAKERKSTLSAWVMDVTSR